MQSRQDGVSCLQGRRVRAGKGNVKNLAGVDLLSPHGSSRSMQSGHAVLFHAPLTCVPKCTYVVLKRTRQWHESTIPSERQEAEGAQRGRGQREALRLLWDKGQEKKPWRRSGQEGTGKMPNHSADCSPRETVMQDPLLPLPQNLWEGRLCFLLERGRSGRIREGLAQNEDGSCIGGPRAGGEGPMSKPSSTLCVPSEGTQRSLVLD